MSRQSFLILAAVIAALYGVGFELAPGLLAAMYGVELTPALAMMDRYFGVSLFGVAAACWAVKGSVEAAILQPFLIGFGVSNAVGVVVSVHATTSNVLNAAGWANVLIYVGLTAGCAYFYRDAFAEGSRTFRSL